MRKTITRILLVMSAAALVFSCCPLVAHADPADPPTSSATSGNTVTLTVNQTLALYGTSLTANYWTGDPYNSSASSSGQYLPITFHYAYPLSSIGYMDTGGGFTGTGSNDFSPNQVNNDIRYMNGLVYIADASQWGYGEFPTNNAVLTQGSYENNPLYNLHLPLTINLEGITDIVQYIGWSTSYFSLGRYYQVMDSGYSSGWSAYYAYNDNCRAIADFCDWTLYTNSAVDPHGKALESPTVLNSSGQRVTGFKQIPFYRYYASDAAMDESMIARFSFFRVSGGAASGTSFDVSGIDLGVQNLSPLYSHQNAGNSTPPTGDIAIIIGCPKIYDYTEPAVTTAPVSAVTTAPRTTRAPAQTAVSYVTGSGIDLSNIESGIREIIWNQEQQKWQLSWIGQNMEGAVNNLALICQKLDAIYDLMEKQGDISQPNTAFDDWMLAALSTHTTARIPDEAAGGLSFIAYLLEQLNQVSWFAAIGALGLATGVAYWIIFKGRG